MYPTTLKTLKSPGFHKKKLGCCNFLRQLTKQRQSLCQRKEKWLFDSRVHTNCTSIFSLEFMAPSSTYICLFIDFVCYIYWVSYWFVKCHILCVRTLSGKSVINELFSSKEVCNQYPCVAKSLMDLESGTRESSSPLKTQPS